MDVNAINQALSTGERRVENLLPHLKALEEEPVQFKMSFGLDTLPTESGLISVRGARQYGKSTWLESQIRETLVTFGPGSAFYLNGDLIKDSGDLAQGIRNLLPLYEKKAPVRRLFIDEITAVADWQKALKILSDAGDLKKVLIITTGSKASDLRKGTERLPGRKGKLSRTHFLFTPVGFGEFKRVCGKKMGKRALEAYLISGGSPVALSEIARHGTIPEYVVEMVRDWIYGEAAAAGRSRASLVAVLEVLFGRGGTPVGQAKLAREAGLANNTVAAVYADFLADMMCLAHAHVWDASRKVQMMRKPCKYHFINLLVAVAWHPSRLRSVSDFRVMEAEGQGMWWEWLAAQELWRRRAIAGEEFPEWLPVWQGKEHELDFVTGKNDFLEIKRGKASPLEFAWFSRSFPGAHLTVVSESSFETDCIRGITWEEFLENGP